MTTLLSEQTHGSIDLGGTPRYPANKRLVQLSNDDSDSDSDEDNDDDSMVQYPVA
jgi:hypothetical protein